MFRGINQGHHWCTEKVHPGSLCLDLSYCNGGLAHWHNPTLVCVLYRNFPDRVNIPGPSFCTHLLSEELQPIKQFNRHLPCAGSCAWSCGDDGRIRSSLCFQIPSTPSGEKGSLQKGRSLRTQVFGMRWRGHGHARGRWSLRQSLESQVFQSTMVWMELPLYTTPSSQLLPTLLLGHWSLLLKGPHMVSGQLGLLQRTLLPAGIFLIS